MLKNCQLLKFCGMILQSEHIIKEKNKIKSYKNYLTSFHYLKNTYTGYFDFIAAAFSIWNPL